MVNSWEAGGRQYGTLRLTYWNGTDESPFVNAMPGYRTAPTAAEVPTATEVFVGTPFDGGFTADGKGRPAYRVASGSLPVGVSLIAATGRLIGAPTTAGTYPVTVEADNGAEDVAAGAVTLTVTAPAVPGPGSNSAVCMGDRGKGAEHANPRAKHKRACMTP